MHVDGGNRLCTLWRQLQISCYLRLHTFYLRVHNCTSFDLCLRTPWRQAFACACLVCTQLRAGSK